MSIIGLKIDDHDKAIELICEIFECDAETAEQMVVNGDVDIID